MKRILLTTITTILVSASLCQIPNRKGKINFTDTTRKGKTSGISVSSMSNTVSATSNPAVTNTSQSITTVNTTKPLTLEELNQKIISLQASVEQLNKRLPYSGVAFLNVVVDNNNFDTRKNRIRIDNELCNGNPAAKIYFDNTVRVFFEENNWYIRPGWFINGVASVELETSIHPDKPSLNNVTLRPTSKNSGLLLAQATNFYIGETFNIIIVKDFPDYNPAIYQIMPNQ